jgi:hypothetical protein
MFEWEFGERSAWACVRRGRRFIHCELGARRSCYRKGGRIVLVIIKSVRLVIIDEK